MINLTQEEQENLKGNKEGIRQLLINKAILDKAKKQTYSELEERELEYITNSEKSKYYLLTKVTPKINIEEKQVLDLYEKNKEYFNSQNIKIEDAKITIQNDLYNQQAAQIESEVLKDLIDNLGGDVVLTKEDIQLTVSNPETLRTFLLNKIVLEEASKNNFYEEEKIASQNIEDNVLLNYYADKTIKSDINVTQEEMDEVFNKEKENFANISVQEAYNQIWNFLVNQRATTLKIELSNKIAEEYHINEIAKEYN